jgi:hypothetical protein
MDAAAHPSGMLVERRRLRQRDQCSLVARRDAGYKTPTWFQDE